MFNQEKVKEWFKYKDGSLYWNINYGGGPSLVGKRAGTEEKHKKGARRFIRIRIDGKRKRFAESRLIFLYHYGYLPEQVDHKNRNQLDNRIDNLRPANNSLNGMNKGVRKDNKFGYKGVCKSRGRYIAQCSGKYLGAYLTPIDAAKAYNKEAIKKHGEFVVLNDV